MMHWNVYCNLVDSELSIYKRPAFMQRPATVPIDDGELYQWLVRARTGKPSHADSEFIRDVNFWREAVEESTQASIRRLQSVCAALYWTERINDPSLEQRRVRLRAFIRSEYGVIVPLPCPDDYAQLCERWASDPTAFPAWILTGKKPTFDVRQEHDEQMKAQRRVGGDEYAQVLGAVVVAINETNGGEL
jgi:hypothetical protein